MYRCPADFDDGLEITFRSEDERLGHLLDPALPYDLIFVDSFHTMECSLRDLRLALDLPRPRGTIVVQDCCPGNKELCGPSFRPGGWFGMTYCAYIEFVLSNADLVYYTVNTDWGCGVIRRCPLPAANHNAEASELKHQWNLEKARQADAYDFFREHRKELLHLISVTDFRARENISYSPLSLWSGALAALRQI